MNTKVYSNRIERMKASDAAKSRLDIDPVTGTELENLVRGLFKLSPFMISKLKTILLPS